MKIMHNEVSETAIQYLKTMSAKVRYNLIAMLSFAGSGHPGGSLSVVEVLTTLYYGKVLKVDPSNVCMPDRDRLVLSKGHASPTLYVILADLGFFPVKKLREFDMGGSMLPKHCDRLKTSGIEASTGALGQGISMAVGMALAERIDKENDYNVYCIVGDGECQSGNLWEAVMSAAKYGLDNLKVVVDNNRLQIDGFTDEIMPLGDLKKKWEAFGWYAVECDGHDVGEIANALNEINQVKGRPQVIIANTIKGKGISFMENDANWHSDKISPQQAVVAFEDLEKGLDPSELPEVKFLETDELMAMRGKK